MAGKQNIVLPSLEEPLSSACLQLLWNKKPSKSERKLRQIFGTHKIREKHFILALLFRVFASSTESNLKWQRSLAALSLEI